LVLLGFIGTGELFVCCKLECYVAFEPFMSLLHYLSGDVVSFKLLVLVLLVCD